MQDSDLYTDFMQFNFMFITVPVELIKFGMDVDDS